MTSDTHDHQHCIRTALEIAERRCREQGVRLTPLRRRILELIWADHRAVKAYDLLDRLRSEQPVAKPATVYRRPFWPSRDSSTVWKASTPSSAVAKRGGPTNCC